MEGIMANSPFEIFVMGIGENRIVACPCEIFVEFALRLKKESPYKNTYLASTSNGYGSDMYALRNLMMKAAMSRLYPCMKEQSETL